VFVAKFGGGPTVYAALDSAKAAGANVVARLKHARERIASVALLPSIVLALSNVSYFPLGCTTVLISVGVALETMKQIDSQLMMRNYEGFLK
jgi:hypothetical protein